ncbi:hypothetical protein [Streptomyces sp. 43Y-GA-1]|uniref:hypothetical protein n=1 Tax=Streptomyces sp. 43Y-GA-1 TaxID=2939435 RepID=UPI0020BE2375|nr:hypothetical protein [Streptomyces sp. 43Y-GA-1]MCL6293250.1 hypothetical protein [Streptomyces sp. 43Y-GA-1]
MSRELAELNLQKINDAMATAGATSEGLDKALTEHVDEAKAAVASGDYRKAVSITAKVLERLEKTEKGSAASAGSGA